MKPFAQKAFILILLIGLSACAGSPAPLPTASLTVPTVAPSPTAIPLYQQVEIVPNSVEENGKSPDYTLKVSAPVLTGSDDRRVADFNIKTNAIVQEEVTSFRKMLEQMTITPIVLGSSFDLSYALISPPGHLLSLQFNIYVYADGAAHPNGYTRSFTYDLEKGQEISREQLFLPGSNYLQTLADICSAELTKRDIGYEMFSDGANPTPENYSVWNITADGLLITFNAYQVAAYAAGPQVITIPYAALENIINPQGPLETYK